MRITGGLEAQNDRLIQIWATKQRSFYSHKPAECGHHFYSRRVKLLRWDLLNIIPLTLKEHAQLHSGNIQIEIQNPFRLQYLQNMCNKNFKDYLLEKGLTEQEYVKECNKKLKEKVNELP
jgi:hypothetical protein